MDFSTLIGLLSVFLGDTFPLAQGRNSWKLWRLHWLPFSFFFFCYILTHRLKWNGAIFRSTCGNWCHQRKLLSFLLLLLSWAKLHRHRERERSADWTAALFVIWDKDCDLLLSIASQRSKQNPILFQCVIGCEIIRNYSIIIKLESMTWMKAFFPWDILEQKISHFDASVPASLKANLVSSTTFSPLSTPTYFFFMNFVPHPAS